MVQNMQSQTTLSTDEFGLGFMTGDIEVTPEFLTQISIIILFFTSLLACLLTGVIIGGRAKDGLRYVPFVVAGSIVLFFLAKMFIGTFFASMT
jgi:putative Mn2+ efflux pump MntP